MDSIWSAGQPWKVESVTVSEICGGRSISENSARSPLSSPRSTSKLSAGAFSASMKPVTFSLRMPSRS